MIRRKARSLQTALARHKWRYLVIVLGLVLLVSPAALLVRTAYAIQGTNADATLHKICYRMPFDWMAAGEFSRFDGRWLLIAFLGIVLSVAFFRGPLFCGWLCPVGSASEGLSRITPGKWKIDLRKRLGPSYLRYGFLAAFGAVAMLAAFAPSMGLASICCRYCASSQMENLVGGIFNPSSLTYWHSGAVMAIGGWLVLGGVLWKGGRGWCLYACPLGAVSNIFHWVGSKLPFTHRLKHDASKCIECNKCEDICPTWAIERYPNETHINRHTCNVCLECVKICPKGCYSYAKE